MSGYGHASVSVPCLLWKCLQLRTRSLALCVRTLRDVGACRGGTRKACCDGLQYVVLMEFYRHRNDIATSNLMAFRGWTPEE